MPHRYASGPGTALPPGLLGKVGGARAENDRVDGFFVPYLVPWGESIVASDMKKPLISA